MSISLSFAVLENRNDRAARRRGKPPARRPPLTLEALEDRTAPSAVPHAVPAALAILPPTLGTSGVFDPGGRDSLGARAVSGQARVSMSSNPPLQALLQEAASTLRTLSKDLTGLADQLPGIAGDTLSEARRLLRGLLTNVAHELSAATSSLHGIASLLPGLAQGTEQAVKLLGSVVQDVAGTLTTVADTVHIILSQLPGLTGTRLGSTTQLIGSLLSDVASSAGATAKSLHSLANSAADNTAKLLNTVVTGVNSSLKDVASSLQALTGTLSALT